MHDGLLIGLTGGIGCGKSTVGRMFSQKGRLVLSADDVANHLTARDPQIRAGLLKIFGRNTFLANGSLNRTKLASEVFRNPTLLSKLNALVHPGVIASLVTQIDALSLARSFPFVVVEAALIYEAHLDRMFDYVVVVDAPLEARIARVVARDGVSRGEVFRRIRSQMPMAEKKRRADFVINNGQGESELLERVSFVDRLLASTAEEPLKPPKPD